MDRVISHGITDEFLIAAAWFPNFQSGQQVALWSMYLLTYSTLAVAICRSLLAVNPTFSRANLRLGVAIGVALSMLPSLVLMWTFRIHDASLQLFALTIFNPFAYSAISREHWALVTPVFLVALIGVHLLEKPHRVQMLIVEQFGWRAQWCRRNAQCAEQVEPFLRRAFQEGFRKQTVNPVDLLGALCNGSHIVCRPFRLY